MHYHVHTYGIHKVLQSVDAVIQLMQENCNVEVQVAHQALECSRVQRWVNLGWDEELEHRQVGAQLHRYIDVWQQLKLEQQKR